MKIQISKRGLQKLAQWEGEVKDSSGKHVVYEDAAGLLTIGVGHLLTEEELSTEVILIENQIFNWTEGLPNNVAYQLLSKDVQWAQDAVDNNVRVFLMQNQFDTLVSFVFNVGATNFRSSTLLKLLNQGKYEAVPEQLRRWNKAAGKTLRGLIVRRQHEIDYWNSGL